ncbi:phosphoadenylyl-sulfate reductase [Aridibaculum aurantiacum]|uniref:phosphoadenylyl-sulfate reductase n=1 Tax=Aridibaculum aurantiacum TaxID=2810307 RepID=UPI001A965CF2|nr:phosphoadenylyl-sulfate reductase [Aridibaculum aurantiacum]
MQQLPQLQQLFATLPIEEALKQTAALFPGKTRFSSSLGQEDQMLTDIIARNQIDIHIFTIDTGRLFYQAYDTLDKTTARYKIKIDVYFPQADAVQHMVKEHGVNLFYESVANRQLCCNVRKVEPLNCALQDTAVWITGLRSAQNDHRKNIPVVEWLEERKIYKINPLLHYSFDEVLAYLEEHAVPYNPLHDQGFLSIGCAPCTRAISEGEDARAGRWWWETSHKECGLHLVK